MPKPNSRFDVWSPDAVAECLEGIDTNSPLYQKLWAFAEQLPKDTSEVPDNFEVRCTSKVWDKFTNEEQTLLNSLAEAEDRKYDNDL